MGKSYRDLVAWQKAMDLVTAIYRVTSGFPRDEIYGLTSQLREQPCRFQATSRKGKDVLGLPSFDISSGRQMDR